MKYISPNSGQLSGAHAGFEEEFPKQGHGVGNVPGRKKFDIDVQTLKSILKYSGNHLCKNCEELQIQWQEAVFYKIL